MDFPKVKMCTDVGFVLYFLALFECLFLCLPHGSFSLKLLILFLQDPDLLLTHNKSSIVTLKTHAAPNLSINWL